MKTGLNEGSAFSRFFREATSEEKHRVYTAVIEKSIARQLEILEKANPPKTEVAADSIVSQ